NRVRAVRSRRRVPRVRHRSVAGAREPTLAESTAATAVLPRQAAVAARFLARGSPLVHPPELAPCLPFLAAGEWGRAPPALLRALSALRSGRRAGRFQMVLARALPGGADPDSRRRVGRRPAPRTRAR